MDVPGLRKIETLDSPKTNPDGKAQQVPHVDDGTKGERIAQERFHSDVAED